VRKCVCSVGLTVLMSALCVGQTWAQAAAGTEPKTFVNMGVGVQPQHRTVTATDSFTIFDETATITSVHDIRNGALFDVGGGFHVSPQFAIGAGFSTFGRAGTGTITASIPNPVFYDRPATATANVSDLEHKERSLHLQAIYFAPVSPKVDVAVSAGPSFIFVSQDFGTASVGSQGLAPTHKNETGTAVGFNAGVQINYLFQPQFGLGFFLGYDGGSLDLPSSAGMHVGGFRTGLAFQTRF
jgi:hypothetical protein